MISCTQLTCADFTFPLEQKKVYALGRGTACDVRFLEKRVRMKEGTVEVGDWDPSNVSGHILSSPSTSPLTHLETQCRLTPSQKLLPG
jgi:hypothetical protein